MNSNLKLYVWEGVLTDWTSGIVVALAESVEQARELIREKDPVAMHTGELDLEPEVIESPAAFVVWGGG